MTLIFRSCIAIPLLTACSLIFTGLGHALLGRIRLGITFQLALHIMTLTISYSVQALDYHHIAILGWSWLILHASYFFSLLYTAKRITPPLWQQVTPLPATAFLFALVLFSATLFSLKSQIFGIDIYNIKATSMTPTLYPGDYVIVSTRAYEQQAPKTNDIVIFKHSERASTYFIKRIRPTPAHFKRNINKKRYMLGDNAKASFDSRSFGLIRDELIIGKAIALIPNPTGTKKSIGQILKPL